MRARKGSGTRGSCAALIAGALLACAMPEPARAEERPDSALVFKWTALYLNRIDIREWSSSFPWNDRAGHSHVNDRLAVLGEIIHPRGIAVFGKGATGFRLGGEYQEQQFILDQAHIGFDVLGGAVSGRLFSRERVYRTDQRLLKLLSNESDALVDRGEGVALEANAGGHLSLSYVESILRDDVAIRGGLPSYHGGEDRLRVMRLEGFQRTRWHAGFTVSEMRGGWYGDRITVGTDLGLRVRGIDLLAELARTRSGGWKELRSSTLFDLNWSAARLDDFGAMFSENDVFAAEIEGLKLGMGDLGTAGLVPGYRYAGYSVTSFEGELPRGLREGYLTAWWKPVHCDALLSVDAADGEWWGQDFRRLVGSARMRYRGGFELRESILCAEGERSSAAISFIDDNAFSRIVMTARIDDLGEANLLTYLARGTLNFGSRLSATSSLYLYRSRLNRYNVEIEFRPRERFLFQASLGSLVPWDESIQLDGSFDAYSIKFYPPSGDRFIMLFTRIWFGGEGTR
ncbi:MAG: hypothetical protein NTW97_06170 [Candidatus Krumholzibacteria bacterium]|nr:hypothetical protein [Candidatus Krumholzibacteria bacterium]